jgi:hypothetical protein
MALAGVEASGTLRVGGNRLRLGWDSLGRQATTIGSGKSKHDSPIGSPVGGLGLASMFAHRRTSRGNSRWYSKDIVLVTMRQPRHHLDGCLGPERLNTFTISSRLRLLRICCISVVWY